MAKRNAEVVLQYSTLYPFKLRGKTLVCVYCCDEMEDPDQFRCHIDETHKTVNLYAAFAHTRCKDRVYLKVDCSNIKCRLCDEPFDTVDEIARHLTAQHYNDDIRDMNLDYEVGLHPYRLNKDKLFCLVCNMKQPNLTTLTRHMSTHYASYACDTCDKKYSSMKDLRYHKRFRHSEKKHICRRCLMEFSTAEEKKVHLKTSSKCWGFGCTHCNERFSCYENKEKHMVSEHDAQPTKYPCSDCGVVFDSRVNFYYHYNKMHSDLAHMCSICGQRFGNKGVFDDHVFIVHSGVKQFQCTLCLTEYCRKKDLRKHMLKCIATE